MPAQLTTERWPSPDVFVLDTARAAAHVENHQLERHAAWRTVAQQRVYFGHQSVGNDVLRGVAELSQRHALKLRIAEALPVAPAGPAIVHFAAGRNEDPSSKNDALLRVLGARPAPDGALVLLKYCYVDMSAGTDIWRLFAAYRRFVVRVERAFPDVTMVHVTMPLTTSTDSLGGRLRNLLDRTPDREVAVARHRYNTLLREAFAGRAPLFDLAAAESTRDDGSRAGVLRRGEWIDVMAPAHTSDGGHLSARGARRAAAALLDALAAASRAGAAS